MKHLKLFESFIAEQNSLPTLDKIKEMLPEINVGEDIPKMVQKLSKKFSITPEWTSIIVRKYLKEGMDADDLWNYIKYRIVST
jgi:hypothetical protein